MPRVVTQADVDAVAPGGTLTVDADATITNMASQRAASRGVKLVQGAVGQGTGRDASRDLVRSVTRAVVARVGHAGPKVVETVVEEVLASLGGGGDATSDARRAPASPALISPTSITTPRGASVMALVSDGGAEMLDICSACIAQEKQRKTTRAVLTTTGRNTKGVVARVTARIAEFGGDILDISQTLVGDFFTMIIVIDIGALTISFERFQDAMQKTVAEAGCQAMLMHEDVMSSLHRV